MGGTGNAGGGGNRSWTSAVVLEAEASSWCLATETSGTMATSGTMVTSGVAATTSGQHHGRSDGEGLVPCGGGDYRSCSGDAHGDDQSSGRRSGDQQQNQKRGDEHGSDGLLVPQSSQQEELLQELGESGVIVPLGVGNLAGVFVKDGRLAHNPFVLVVRTGTGTRRAEWPQERERAASAAVIVPYYNRPRISSGGDRTPSGFARPDRRRPGGGGIVCSSLRRQRVAADRAGVVLEQPGDDAVGVVQVLARHLPRLRPSLKLVRADRALRVIVEMPAGYLHQRHGVDRGPRSRRWPLAVASLQHQLLKHGLEAGTGEEAAEVCSAGADSAAAPDEDAAFAGVSRSHVAAEYQPGAKRGLLPPLCSACPSCVRIEHRVAAHFCHPLAQKVRHRLHHSKSSILAIVEAWPGDTESVQRASYLADILDEAIVAVGAAYILSTQTNWTTAGVAPMCGSI